MGLDPLNLLVVTKQTFETKHKKLNENNIGI